MEIKTAEFVKGIIGTNKILENKIPQIVFIGRSNVGKSSVINSLVNRKNLVKSSSTPGKTRQINFFLINKKIYFVDLPGYGFIKASKKQIEKIKKMIFWYLFRSNTKFEKIILIIDIRIGLTELDKKILELINQNNYSLIIVANKADKLKTNEIIKKLETIKKIAPNNKIIQYSAKTKRERKKVLNLIFDKSTIVNNNTNNPTINNT